MLVRPGNKQYFSKAIQKYFPPHIVYNEPFFGAGGLFFNKPLAKYNVLNDKDGDVFNLWTCVRNEKEALKQALRDLIYHEGLFYHWMDHKEEDPIMSAVRFLFLSNYSFLGKQDCCKLIHSNISHNEKLVSFIDIASGLLQRCLFRCVDFKDFYSGIIVGDKNIPISKRFSYIDSPYVGTSIDYGSKWSEKHSSDCIEIHLDIGIKFAMSEYNTKLTRKIADKYGLKLIKIGYGCKLGRKSEEVILVNYDLPNRKQLSIF